jgi:hypothetical protein
LRFTFSTSGTHFIAHPSFLGKIFLCHLVAYFPILF